MPASPISRCFFLLVQNLACQLLRSLAPHLHALEAARALVHAVYHQPPPVCGWTRRHASSKQVEPLFGHEPVTADE